MAIANITNNILTDSGVATSSLLTTSAAASTYLALAGGTLTGPLSGTSATFTSATETRGNIRTTFPSDNSYYSIFSNDGALTLDTYGVGGYMNFKILGSSKLSIANTGAATFSNSVAVGTIMSVGSNAGAGSLFQYTFSGANANSRTWRTSIDNVTYGDWALQQATTQGGSTFANILIFSNTGAATFSDSIKTGAPSGGTAKPWKLGQDTSTLYSATRTIQVEIDGGTYYLLAVKSTDL
jgi:hypothetical protein